MAEYSLPNYGAASKNTFWDNQNQNRNASTLTSMVYGDAPGQSTIGTSSPVNYGFDSLKAYTPGINVPQFDTGRGGTAGGLGGSSGWLKDYGGMALGAANGAANLFMGMKQYGLAKQTLAENKKQFQMNYDAQRTTTNASLRDRQIARVASDPGAYESVSSYMDRNGIK